MFFQERDSNWRANSSCTDVGGFNFGEPGRRTSAVRPPELADRPGPNRVGGHRVPVAVAIPASPAQGHDLSAPPHAERFFRLLGTTFVEFLAFRHRPATIIGRTSCKLFRYASTLTARSVRGTKYQFPIYEMFSWCAAPTSAWRASLHFRDDKGPDRCSSGDRTS